MKKVSAVKLVRDAVSADSVGKNKVGNIVVRRGYFYRHGDDGHSFAHRIASQLIGAGVSFDIIDCGDHWAPFRGGKGVAANSHFYVELKVWA